MGAEEGSDTKHDRSPIAVDVDVHLPKTKIVRRAGGRTIAVWCPELCGCSQ